MIRLEVVAEGQTEADFVGQILRPNLEAHANHGIAINAPVLGGYRTYAGLKKFVKRLLHSQSSTLRVTTMIDLFKLPADSPGLSELAGTTTIDGVRKLEQLFEEDVRDRRFVPYLQLHEFEALLLSDLPVLAEQHPNRKKEIRELAKHLQESDPEHVNRLRPPSYWIKDVVPEYNKRTSGVITVGRIGLAKLRERCRHFGQWLDVLESLTCDR